MVLLPWVIFKVINDDDVLVWVLEQQLFELLQSLRFFAVVDDLIELGLLGIVNFAQLNTFDFFKTKESFHVVLLSGALSGRKINLETLDGRQLAH